VSKISGRVSPDPDASGVVAAWFMGVPSRSELPLRSGWIACRP
jgi:hypothetical protein